MLTREVAADGTGRHTTTHRELVQLPGGGMVIDTPGLRELQFWEGDLSAAFEDLEALALECKFRNCAHMRSPAARSWPRSTNGTLELDRLRSWRKLQRELEADRRAHGHASPHRAEEALEADGLSRATEVEAVARYATSQPSNCSATSELSMKLRASWRGARTRTALRFWAAP